MKKRRDPFVDNLKAIGIISIVIGHSSTVLPYTGIKIGSFVYLYHLMIFFFASGYCFSKEKAEHPWEYMGSRLGTSVPLYVGYGIAYVLLHNVFRNLHMISSEKEIYDLQKILYYCAASLNLTTAETLLSALWFVPVLFFANAIYFLIFYYSEKSNHPRRMRCMLILAAGAFGIFINYKEIYLNYHMQTSFLAVPVLHLGYLVKENKDRIFPWIRWYGTLIGAVVLYLSLHVGSIELSRNQIFHPLLFYPVTILGIYYCMGLAKLASKSRLLPYIGRNSFHIMALHFTAFKAVDILYGNLTEASAETMEVFPYAFGLWPVYYAAGVFLPLLLVAIGRKFRDGVMK